MGTPKIHYVRKIVPGATPLRADAHSGSGRRSPERRRPPGAEVGVSPMVSEVTRPLPPLSEGLDLSPPPVLGSTRNTCGHHSEYERLGH